jgi:hypothetical protein
MGKSPNIIPLRDELLLMEKMNLGSSYVARFEFFVLLYYWIDV